MIRPTLTAIAVAALMSASLQSRATSIGFDNQGLSGPSFFADAGPAQHINITTDDAGNAFGGTVSLDGGVILTKTSNLPADQTSVYGTSSFAGPSYSSSIAITFTFATPIQNFYCDVLNGDVVNVNYRMTDSRGDFATFNLVPNLSSGNTTIGFAAVGTQVTLTALNHSSSINWDFFVDNLNFNTTLPDTLPTPDDTGHVPDGGATAGLLFAALMGLRLVKTGQS